MRQTLDLALQQYEDLRLRVASVADTLAHLDTLIPRITTVRVFPGENVQAALESLYGTGGILEIAEGQYGALTLHQRIDPRAIVVKGVGDVRLQGLTTSGKAQGFTFEDVTLDRPTGNAHVILGADRRFLTRVEDVPTGFIFRRVRGLGGCRTGIRANCADLLVEDCDFYGYIFLGQDSQAIAGWNGAKNHVIRRSRLGGASQGIIYGGSDAYDESLFPQDILIEDCTLTKDIAWRSVSDIKCGFELKNALRVQFLRNVVENIWADAWPNAPAIKLNVANQEGTNPTARVEDLEVTGCTVRNVGSYVDLVGSNAGPYTSGVARRLRFHHNRFTAMHAEGNGRAIVVNDGTPVAGGPSMDVVFDHNTFEGNTHSYAEIVGTPSVVTYTNNIARRGTYGLRNQNASAWNVGIPAAGNLITVDPPTEDQITACVTTDGQRVGC